MARSDRRRSLRLLDPALQLKLPLQLLAVTPAFGVGLATVGWSGFARPYALMVADLPPHVGQSLELMLRDFGEVLLFTGLLYGLIVVGLSAIYLRRLLGPTIAFRRHLEALKAGDYAARVGMRAGAPFQELGHDLNELASLLQAREEKPETPGAQEVVEHPG